MRVGELSRRTGASVRSLRYYEECGLLASERAASGQRHYSAPPELGAESDPPASISAAWIALAAFGASYIALTGFLLIWGTRTYT